MEFENLLKRVVLALNKADLKYVIVGGFAAIFRGKPRTTMDLDLIIENNLDKFQIFIEHLKNSDFEVLDNQIQTALNEQTHISIFDNLSILRIDLNFAKTIDTRQVLDQARTEIYKGLELKLASVEHILYGKVLYLGDISDIPDSELLEYNDVLDFINVYRKSKKIDLDWLNSKVQEKKLEKTLKRLLKIAQDL